MSLQEQLAARDRAFFEALEGPSQREVAQAKGQATQETTDFGFQMTPNALLVRVSKLKGTAPQVMCALMSDWRPYRREVGMSPSEALRRLGISESTLKRAFKDLRDAGLLELSTRAVRGVTINLYRIPALEVRFDRQDVDEVRFERDGVHS